MCLENRKQARFRAKTGLQASIQAEGSALTARGMVLNVSLGGAYVLAPSIPFETALIRFDPPNAKSVLRKCARVDPHRKGAKGMAIEFGTPLNNDELESLVDAGVPVSEYQC